MHLNSINTNEFISIKNITFIIDKNVFNFQYELKNEHSLQIYIEKVGPKDTLNYGLKDIKSIEFCIEFLITNDKTIYDFLDDSHLINGTFNQFYLHPRINMFLEF